MIRSNTRQGYVLKPLPKTFLKEGSQFFEKDLIKHVFFKPKPLDLDNLAVLNTKLRKKKEAKMLRKRQA